MIMLKHHPRIYGLILGVFVFATLLISSAGNVSVVEATTGV